MDRRNFLKLTVYSAGVLWANRAIGSVPAFIGRDECGLWMRWIGPEGVEFGRERATLTESRVVAVFPIGTEGIASRFELWKDGELIATLAEHGGYGFKTVYSVWEVAIAASDGGFRSDISADKLLTLL